MRNLILFVIRIRIFIFHATRTFVVRRTKNDKYLAFLAGNGVELFVFMLSSAVCLL